MSAANKFLNFFMSVPVRLYFAQNCSGLTSEVGEDNGEEEQEDDRDEELEDTEDTLLLPGLSSDQGVEYTESTSTRRSSGAVWVTRGLGVGRLVFEDTDIVLRGRTWGLVGAEAPEDKVLERGLEPGEPAYRGFLKLQKNIITYICKCGYDLNLGRYGMAVLSGQT